MGTNRMSVYSHMGFRDVLQKRPNRMGFNWPWCLLCLQHAYWNAFYLIKNASCLARTGSLALSYYLYLFLVLLVLYPGWKRRRYHEEQPFPKSAPGKVKEQSADMHLERCRAMIQILTRGKVLWELGPPDVRDVLTGSRTVPSRLDWKAGSNAIQHAVDGRVGITKSCSILCDTSRSVSISFSTIPCGLRSSKVALIRPGDSLRIGSN
jgi:hypothetical protein